MNRKKTINKITKIGIFSALSVILYYIKFNLPAIFPSFLEIHFSMVPALLCTLALGPVEGAIVIVIRFLLKLPSTSTVIVGEIADLIIGLLVVIPAGLLYKFNRTKKGGITAISLACILGILFGTLSNIFTIPLYIELFFGGNVNILVSALSVIPGVNVTNYMSKYLLLGALPFNSLLSILVCVITYFTYKSVSNIFKHDFFSKIDSKIKDKKNIMVMVDSFKGSINSLQAGNIIKEELINKGHNVDVLPISDGGEGFLEVFRLSLNLDYLYTIVNDAFFNIHESKYLFDEKTNTAYVELAANCGINDVNTYDLNPFTASSYGLGEQIKYIIEKHHPKKMIVGIGGSCSIDAGSGMLEALGAKFFDANGFLIEKMNNEKLINVSKIHVGAVRSLVSETDIIIYNDVLNPLLGENGAVYVFGPQKGAKVSDLEKLENNIKHFVDIVEEQVFGIKELSLVGEGAAGGVGFAFNRIVRATMEQGSQKILEVVDFKTICNKYDIIITGEGKFDNQSLNGKIISEIIKYNPKRLIIVCGINEINDPSYEIYSIVPSICSVEESMAEVKKYLASLINTISI